MTIKYAFGDIEVLFKCPYWCITKRRQCTSYRRPLKQIWRDYIFSAHHCIQTNSEGRGENRIFGEKSVFSHRVKRNVSIHQQLFSWKTQSIVSKCLDSDKKTYTKTVYLWTLSVMTKDMLRPPVEDEATFFWKIQRIQSTYAKEVSGHETIELWVVMTG